MNPPTPQLALSLAGHFNDSGGQPLVSITGPYRFFTLEGQTGYSPTSLKTSLFIPTDLHRENEGTIFLSISPLETLATAAPMYGFLAKDPYAQEYGLLGDSFPIHHTDETVFAWYWRSFWHPQMIAKFKKGAAAGSNADYAVTPYVFVEHQPLEEGRWYQLALSWNKKESRFRIYINGVLCGTTCYDFVAHEARSGLYLGNTAMVFAHLEMYDAELPGEVVTQKWEESKVGHHPEIQEQLAALHTVLPKPPVEWPPVAPWQLRYERTLCTAGDFSGWMQEGCLSEAFPLKALEITPEGLLLETPDKIDTESRVYFWSPEIFEGDLAVEYDFRPELNTGLALLIVQASGMQREDIMADHPRRVTGAMGTIISDRIRNYHWEFFRRAVDVRGDLGTQVLIKNPWYLPLGMSARPPFVPGEWYKLLFLQEGSRLRAAINGEWVLDVHDNPAQNNGPIFNSGRIGLRLMYQTRMRFRNLKVWNRSRF